MENMKHRQKKKNEDNLSHRRHHTQRNTCSESNLVNKYEEEPKPMAAVQGSPQKTDNRRESVILNISSACCALFAT